MLRELRDRDVCLSAVVTESTGDEGSAQSGGSKEGDEARDVDVSQHVLNNEPFAKYDAAVAREYSVSDVVEEVRQLLLFQRRVLADRANMKAVEAHLQAHPEEILTGLTSHIMFLFRAPSMAQLLPTVGAVYTLWMTTRNFLERVRLQWNLDVDWTDDRVLRKISEKLRIQWGRGGPISLE